MAEKERCPGSERRPLVLWEDDNGREKGDCQICGFVFKLKTNGRLYPHKREPGYQRWGVR